MSHKDVFRIHPAAGNAPQAEPFEPMAASHIVAGPPTEDALPSSHCKEESHASRAARFTDCDNKSISNAPPQVPSVPSPVVSHGGVVPSAPQQVLAERAFASFRQERRLQRGQIPSPAQPSHRGNATSPCGSPSTWAGLPASVMLLSASPPPPQLPASASDTRHASPDPFMLPRPSMHTSKTHEKNCGEGHTKKVQNATFGASTYEMLMAEDDEGDVEYKWRLTGISATRFQHLVTQMQFRVSEGRGQCLYELGVADDGTPRGLTRRDFDESVQTIQRMAAQLQFEATLLQCCVVGKREITRAAMDTTRAQQKATARRAYPPSERGPFSPREDNGNVHTGEELEELLCGEIMVSRRQSGGARDLSVAFCGAIGCGKSTLMAVLLTSTLDDGRGGTRQSLFNHKHELNSGRTSSLASRVWTVPPDPSSVHPPTQDYDSPSPPPALSTVTKEDSQEAETCKTLPTSASARFQPTWSSQSSPTAATTIAAPPTPPFTCASPRSITLLDAGGDITKTMLFGFMSRKPDYVCVCVAADSSDFGDVCLYAEVCCAMNTPFLVAVTKTDLVEEFELDSFVMELTVALERVVCVAEQVETLQTAAAYCREWLPRHRESAVGGARSPVFSPVSASGHLSSSSSVERLRVPLFCVSSVAGGDGLDLFRSCLSHLQNPPPSPPLSPPSWASKPPFEVLLDYAFEVEDVGPVVRGRVTRGPVEVGCTCYIGPGSDGRFYAVFVRGIHVDGAHVNAAQVGEEATFALDRLPAAVVVAHKGKVLVRQPERVAMGFAAVVQVLSQSISAHMEPIMYTRNARQAVHVVSMSCTAARVEDEEKVPAVPGSASPNALLPPLSTSSSSLGRCECTVVCRFLFRPEVVGPGDAVVLHWAPRGIAVGRITSVEAAHKGAV